MKPRIAILCVLPLVFLIIAGRQPSAAATVLGASMPPRPLPVWRGEVAASGVALGDQGTPGMALDPDGRPHLVYGRNQLFHAWRDGASWQVEIVDPDGGSLVGPVIAIDDAGTIAIVAYTEAGFQRKELTAYSRPPGGQWQATPIPVPWIGSYPVLALALDNDGRPRVLTTGSTADQRPLLIYAYALPQGWLSEPIAIQRDALGSLSLAVDSHNQPVILYETDDEINDGLGLGKILYLARRSASGWTDQSIAQGELITGKSLALDKGDRAHVVFSDVQPNRLVYLRQTDNGWQTLTESVQSHTPSLALDDTGRPHLAYTNLDEDIVYAILGNDGWERTTIPMVGHGGGYNTLLLDETGAAHISTIQYAQNLYYATNRNGAWAAMPVAVLDPVGEEHALALGPDDRLYLLYYHPSAGQLRWAAKEGDTWTTSAVADVGDLPPEKLELDVAVGPNGMARIAYVNGTVNQLVFGTRQGNSWLLEPITTAGHHLALAVGSDNRPQLILIQTNRLVYWTYQGSAWHSEFISPTGAVVANAYLALDSQNRPHVAYTVGSDVMAAVRRGENDWQTETLPREYVEYMVGMALGPDESLHLLTLTFRSEGGKPPTTFYTLWLTERIGGTWGQQAVFEDLYTVENFNDMARLRVDADGTLHLVWRNDWLNYGRREANGQWAGGGHIARDGGNFALAVGSDGQPRVSLHALGDLRLYTRGILWLDQHALLPVVPIKSPYE